jgi:hypothetical protein
MQVRKIKAPTTRMALVALTKPVYGDRTPMASSARNETAPIAVLATEKLDHLRALWRSERIVLQRLVRDH